METGALQDQVIVIVGGTTGLGLSGARACVRAGARVVVVGRDRENAANAGAVLGDHGRVLVGDATDARTAAEAIAAATHEFGRFDGLYHVAGGSGRRAGDGPLHEISDEGWDFTQNLNLRSLFFSNRAAAQQFLKQGTGGVVLNMSSVLGYSPSPEFFATHSYAAAKAAIVGLTTAAASYYAPHNIRFNAVAPALVETPMAKRAAEDETILKFIATKQPLDGGRIGRPDDLDAAVVFLLSDQSKFITGQTLAVDGGWAVSDGQIPGGRRDA
ncbi:MAG TPA: SDR family oxidoreductase [Tepidisphaeraceae bacterium]|nr:SDR family oxidoreductase [Tepidisphaeraceae bacterium]